MMPKPNRTPNYDNPVDHLTPPPNYGLAPYDASCAPEFHKNSSKATILVEVELHELPLIVVIKSRGA